MTALLGERAFWIGALLGEVVGLVVGVNFVVALRHIWRGQEARDEAHRLTSEVIRRLRQL